MKLYQRKANDLAPLGQADPYMIKAGDGRYYLYASGGEGCTAVFQRPFKRELEI